MTCHIQVHQLTDADLDMMLKITREAQRSLSERYTALVNERVRRCNYQLKLDSF